MEEAAQLCDRTIIMDHGRIVAEGTPAELVAAHVGANVVEVYLSGPRRGWRAPSRAWAPGRGGPSASARSSTSISATARPGRASSARLDGLDFARRRATLEDVFLTLTGHALRD